MTSHLEAPGDTGVERAWDLYDRRLRDYINGHDMFATDAVYEQRKAVEAVVRAQLAEEVQRLVEAARRHQEECCYCCAITPLDAALEPFQATTVEEDRSDA